MAVFDPELAARMKMPRELLERASELHLAIHAGDNLVHAALFDFNAGQCLWHVHSALPAGMSAYSFIYGRNWVEGIFRKCTITFDSDLYALVPQSVFDENTCADYIELQHGVAPTSAGCIELPEAEASLCFQWPEWQTSLTRTIPNARVLPLSALVVRWTLAHVPSGENGFTVALSSDTITIAGIKNKSLVVLSTHEARTPEDVLYHLSNAALRLVIDLEHARVHVMEAEENRDVVELLKRYVKEVKSIGAPAGIDSPAITQMHFLCA